MPILSTQIWLWYVPLALNCCTAVAAKTSVSGLTHTIQKAIDKWKSDPVFSPHYHETGFINVTSKAASPETKAVIGKYYDSISNHPAWKGQVTPIDGSAAVKKLAPKFTGPMDGWIGYHNKLAGYGQAASLLW